jgi:hypothetical protein
MLDNLLRARYHWDRGESENAFGHLHRVLGARDGDEAFLFTASEAKHQAKLPFEIAIANILLTEDVLVDGFDAAFIRLWRALPLQYLIVILSQRSLDRAADAAIIDLLAQAAQSGLLSNRADDYDLSGKVVLDPEAYPEIVEFLGGSSVVQRASADDAWKQQIAPNADMVIDLFLYAVFHREPSTQPEMILDRLERIAGSHEPFLKAFSTHLATRVGDLACHQPLVSVGMRIEGAHDATTCVEQFVEVLASRQFEPFVARYYQET